MEISPERWLQLKEVFRVAIESEPQQRAAFLDQSCANDPVLREEIESLLTAHDGAEQFIEQPALASASEILSTDARDSWAGRSVGQYRILREIGRGGMGLVLLAVRADDQFKQRVAIKILRRGMDTEDILRRFRNERQILASLEHSNIARLLDGGMTDDGLPYFVMEYIEGEPLDKYADEHKLSTNQRLRLFRTVCAAVQHAHQNLVIHRDLKPSNILVTSDGEPKLLDFGIAKVLNPELTAQTIAPTATFMRLMTPEYASPEQIRGKSISTVSDVYSLGVLLYRLLTSHSPYHFMNRSPEEIEHLVCEIEPEKPSTAINRTEEIRTEKGITKITPATVSQWHDEQTDALRRRLRGDLDNIVLKALRKEPERRYTSAAQLSEDIRRYIAGLPVSARKDTFTYRASKFIGRNKVAAIAAAFFTLAIIAGLVIALWQADNARRQRDLAQHERAKAERINQFLQRMLSFSNQSVTSVSPVAVRKDVTVNEMLDQITPQVENELADQPEIRAQILRTIGSAYASQGQYDSAEKYLREALETQTQLDGEESAEAAATIVELGVLSYRQQKLDEAGRLLGKAVTFYRKQQQANSPEYSAAKFALALDHLGVVKYYQGDVNASLSLLKEALQISSGANLQGNERGVLTFNKSDLGGVLVAQGDTENGERLLDEAAAEYRQISDQPRWELGATLVMLGIAALNQNRLDEAERYLLESERIFRQTLGDANSYLVYNLDRQAAVWYKKNNLKAAEEKSRESVAMAQEFSPHNKLSWAGSLLTLGDIVTKAGRFKEGEDYYRQVLATYEAQATKNFATIVSVKIHLSQSLLAQNRLADAEQIALEAHDEAGQNLDGQNPTLKATTENLIKIYEKQGKHDLAQRLK
jgi:serine/threonine protein kinase